MKKTILVFGALSLVLLVLFQLSKYSIATGNLNTDFFVAIIAILSFVIGIVYHKKTNQLPQETSSKQEIDLQKIKELEITTREYDVLQLIAKGMSNKEIADELFLSESTIKTHVSNLLSKLNAKRRTQALQIAKELNII
ncbi:response regulator transcription factor [Tenacibaculum agarivorans]|uniref:response regulator transcription factor n=1 Tax=Tenacibaculum agarivorans TaxID=1908389 RepID=UPI00094B91FC|nr:response regulator transcription factor [Tenacibaculum agarivorans]